MAAWIVVTTLVVITGLLLFVLREVRKKESTYPSQVSPPHVVCSSCGLTVARYNEFGVCANCQTEGNNGE